MANFADIFMKPLPIMHFRMLRDKMVSDLQVFIANGAVATAKLLLIISIQKGWTSMHNASMVIE